MTSRSRTPIDVIAEAWVDTLVDHEPTVGTYIGRSASNRRLPDFSPDGAAALAESQQRTLDALLAAPVQDAVDAVTRADLTAELRHELEWHPAGEHLRNLNVIESPPQQIRDIFDLMPTDSECVRHEWCLTLESTWESRDLTALVCGTETPRWSFCGAT